MIFNKNIAKLMFRLKQKETVRKTAQIVKKRFGMTETIAEIERHIVKIFGPKETNRKYTEWQMKILKRFYAKCKDTALLLAYFNKKYSHRLTQQNLRDLMFECGIKKGRRNVYTTLSISKEQERNIVSLYQNGMTTTELAIKFNYKRHKSICDILKNNGVKRKTQEEIRASNVPYNEFNFKTINSEFKAYYLGLLLTDGYLIKNSNIVGIQLCDKDCIEYLANELKVNVIRIKKKNPKCKTMYRMSIFGKEYIDQLKRLGVTTNKSLTLQGPKLNAKEKMFIPTILRGIIDGDGWVRKDGNEFFICSASELFAKWCKEKLEELGMQGLKIKYVQNKCNGVFYIRTGIRENIKILRSEIYNEQLGMERKFDRAHGIRQRRSETIMKAS